MLAWKSGQHLVESDLELAAFRPAGKLNELKLTTDTDLLNPFGMELYQDDEDEEMYNQFPHKPSWIQALLLYPTHWILRSSLTMRMHGKMDLKV